MNAPRVVLITRSAEGADAYGDFITAQGHQVLYEPMLSIEALDVPLPDLSPYQALIFTSVHAVTIFAAQSDVRDIPVFTVGDVTAYAAQADVRQDQSARYGRQLKKHFDPPTP